MSSCYTSAEKNRIMKKSKFFPFESEEILQVQLLCFYFLNWKITGKYRIVKSKKYIYVHLMSSIHTAEAIEKFQKSEKLNSSWKPTQVQPTSSYYINKEITGKYKYKNFLPNSKQPTSQANEFLLHRYISNEKINKST